MPCGVLVCPVTLAVGGLSKIISSFPQGRTRIWSLRIQKTLFLLLSMKGGKKKKTIGMFADIPKSSGGTHKQTHTHNTQLFPAGSDSWRPNKHDKHTYMCGACLVQNFSECSCTASLVTAGYRSSGGRPRQVTVTSVQVLKRRGEHVSVDPIQLRGSFGSLFAARQAWG